MKPLFAYASLIIIFFSISCSNTKRYSTKESTDRKIGRRFQTIQDGKKSISGSKFELVTSYYAHDFHGKKTANGEIFDMYDFTAAHRTLPFDTLLRVTNISNGKSVIVRINDRGPFIRGRDLDLSYASAKKIGMIEEGVKTLLVEIIE